MLQLQRQNDILKLLSERGELTVKELCSLLYASAATIRRDLSELEAKGLLKRSFGGAVLTDSYTDQLPLAIRSATHIAEKKKICAKAAAKYIHPGDTIFIDASSTTYFLAQYLKGIPDITVITNNPHLSIVLSEQKIRNFCTGGEMLNSSIALIGSEAEGFIRRLYANAMFFSARGVCGNDISDSSKAERDIKAAMLARSDKHYFLCDTSKKEKRFTYTVADLSQVDEVVDEGE